MPQIKHSNHNKPNMPQIKHSNHNKANMPLITRLITL